MTRITSYLYREPVLYDYAASRRSNFAGKEKKERRTSSQKTQKHLNIDRQRGINRVQFEAVKLELGIERNRH